MSQKTTKSEISNYCPDKNGCKEDNRKDRMVYNARSFPRKTHYSGVDMRGY